MEQGKKFWKNNLMKTSNEKQQLGMEDKAIRKKIDYEEFPVE